MPQQLDWTFRFIDDPRNTRPHRRQRAKFKRSFTSVRELVEREIRHLGGKHIVIEAGNRKVRNDGWPYSGDRPEHPAVVIYFDSKHGPLRYECDTYNDRDANIQAIGMTMERQRAIERYGAVKAGQQYAGWKALPPAGGEPSKPGDPAMPLRTVEDAAAFIATHAKYRTTSDIVRTPEAFRQAYRTAAVALHPDTNGGDDRGFKRLQEAKAILEKHHHAAAA